MKTKISHLGRSTVSVILAVMMLLSTMLVGTITTVSAYDISKNVTIYYANTEKWSSTPNLYYWRGSQNNNVDLENISNTGIYKKTFSDNWSNLSGFIIRNGTTWENGKTADICDDVSQNTYFYGKSETPNTNLSQLNGTAKVINMVSVDNGTSYNELASGCVTTVSGYNLPSGAVSTTAVSSSTSSASSNASIEAAFGSTITYSATADSNYEFKGFSTTNSPSLPNNLNTNATMKQTSSAINGNSNNVYYAYYVAKNIQTPVAESVSLTALPATVTSGGSTTLTATLTGKKSDTVTLTLVDGNGTTVETKSVTTDSAEFTVTPSAETTYKVVARAEGYNSVESATVTVHIVGSKTFYLWRADDNKIDVESVWDIPVEMQMNADGKYVCDVDVKSGNNYVTITKDKVNPYNSLTAWNSLNDVKVNVTETSNIISIIYPQSYNVDKAYYFPLFSSTKEGRITFTFDGDKSLVASDAGSTPVGDVTINVPDVQNATVTAKSGNETAGEGGSLTVANGSTFEVTVTPNDGYEIAGITYNGNTQTTSPATFTAAVSGGITVTVNKPTEAAQFKVAYGSNPDFIEMVATRNNGIYISTAAVAFANDDNLVNSTPNAQFTIYDSKNSKYAVFDDNSYIWLTSSNPSDTVDRWVTSYTHGVGKGLLNNGYDKVMYVIYNANTWTVTLTDSFDTGDKATLYVKTGTSGTGATGEYASKSEASKLSATSSGTTYKKYSVEYDTNVNIQTTMSDNYLKARYYVAGYSVNGRSYPASAVDASKGIYQANITITEDLAENGVVEVTPIYYNRTIEENDNYITFYVDAERLVGDWGSTVAIYAYAYKGGTATYKDGKVTNNVNLLGAYPGQPMVKDGQYYVAKIPRCNYEISPDGSLEIDRSSTVAGITLNNYYNDAVHNSLVPIKRNMQTYDFSDFVALANKKDVKTIMFQSKFYNATGDAKRNTKVIYGYDTEISDPTIATKQIDNIKSADVNPYEDFTDYYGRATDLIGNILHDNQKDDENNLYVISTGSYNSSNSTSGYSTKGEWVTIWNVYDHNGNLITYGTPANFLDETTEQYKKIAENYSGKPVRISYEKGLVYGQNKDTSRTDGRWYYSTLGQEFTSDVAIEYKHRNDNDYTADTDSNAGNNTGFVGETTKATATINNVTTASFSSVTETAHLNVKVSNGWRFDGWFIKQGDKYTKVSDNYTDISTDVLMSNSYHIVARVSEIPTGTLELNHTAYTGTDPAAHTGTGFYYISAVVKKADNSKIEFDETQGVISIPDFAATDELTITLRAKCHGDNTVYALYKGEAGGYTEIGTGLNGKSEFTHTVTVSAGSLFENGELSVNALNYYTDIVKVGGTCDITYKYKDRFGVEGEGNMVSYVVRNVELSTQEIQDNYQPSNSTITKYAPRIDTMYVDTKWKLDVTGMVEKGKSQATVIATQTPKTCKVYHPVLGDNGYYTDIQDSASYTVEFNSLLKDENGNFLLKTPEYNADKTLKFAYWEVYKVNKNGQSEGEVVTKCYERNFGLRIMADYYIVPVYSENVPNLTANINSPVLNREIYGDSANPTDKLYVDLLTAFTSTAIPTFKENTTKLSVECGVFVVRNNTSNLSVEDRNTLVNAAISNSTDTTSDILLKGYIRDRAVEEGLITKLRDLAKDSNVKDKTNTVANFGNDEYRITKLVFDNNSLTNKNRIDEVLKYTNNTANQNYIFTAYAFVVIKDSHGTVQEMQISNPQYYNLCYVGNKALDNN